MNPTSPSVLVGCEPVRRMRLALSALLWVAAASNGASATLTISPASIVWNTNTWVNFDLNGVTAGSAVDLHLYVDADGNERAGTNDVLLMQFRLRDGMSNNLGAQIVVCDTNGAADGRIVGRVSYHGLSDYAQLWHATGQYVWQAAYTNGLSITSAVFTVTQPASAVWITGTVASTNFDSHAGGPLPGACILMDLWSRNQGFAPSTWTDSNGNFTLYLPGTVTADNVAAIFPLKPGFFEGAFRPGTSTPMSTHRFAQPLLAGANALPAPLYLLSASASGTVHTLSGTVTDSLGRTVPGAFVMAQPEGDSDEGGMSLGVSGADGTFAVPWPHGTAGIGVACNASTLNQRALAGVGMGVGSVTQNMSGLGLVCPVATTLVRIPVRNAGASDGVIGAKVWLSGGSAGSSGFSFTQDGMCELCFIGASNASAELDEDSLRPHRRICPASAFNGLTIPASGVFSNVAFTTYPGYIVSGHVYGEQSSPLAGGGVYAQEAQQSNGSADDMRTTVAGAYELLVGAGDYRVGTWGYGSLGYLDQTRADNVTVTTADIGGIDFHLARASSVRGRVLGSGNPLDGMQVDVGTITLEANGDWYWGRMYQGQTDSNGDYAVSVPAGTNYYARVQPHQGALWLEQFYSNATDVADATAIPVMSYAPVTNIDFNLQAGAVISGRVLGGGTPLVDIEVNAGRVTFWQGGGWDFDNLGYARSDSNGFYTMVLPPGTNYTVVANDYNPGSSWLRQYYSNAADIVSATFVSALPSAPATDIDFNLQAGAVISGRVLGGGTPLVDIEVKAGRVTFWQGGGWDFDNLGYARSDSNGFYTMVLPPGTNYTVVANDYNPGSSWLRQYYSNTFDIAQALPVTALTSAPATGIDFNLQAGAVISGQVLGDGQPIPGLWVGAGTVTFGADGNWWWNPNQYYGGNTDSNGCYTLMVMSGTNYYVQANPPPQFHWSNPFYNDAFDIHDATPVAALVHAPATNINFHFRQVALNERYVSTNGAHIYPYASWHAAATNIQDAVDAASDGMIVRVSNGTYRLSREILVTKGLTLRSENGAAATVVDGGGGTRCFWVSNSVAVVDGFTVTGGNPSGYSEVGGGLILGLGVVQNCIISGNVSSWHGGGALCTGGLLWRCAISGNQSHFGGGVYCERDAVILECTISGNTASGEGGGVECFRGATVSGCDIVNNVAYDYGGGVRFWQGASLIDSRVVSNSFSGGSFYEHGAGVYGANETVFGEAYAPATVLVRNCVISMNGGNGSGAGAALFYGSNDTCTVENCTIVGNTRTQTAVGEGAAGIHAFSLSLRNSIIYDNTGPLGGNDNLSVPGTVEYCCTTNAVVGAGCMDAAPLLVDPGAGDYRLRPDSPCIDAGTNLVAQGVTNDCDGVVRPLDGDDDGVCAFDIGAHEFMSSSADSDHDGARDVDEIVAGTALLDPASCFRICALSNLGPDCVEYFPSVSGRMYRLEWRTNLLLDDWSCVPGMPLLPGDGGILSFCHTNSTSPGFYRIKARRP